MPTVHLDISKVSSAKGTSYSRVLLRSSYREGGKIKHRTLGNLSSCSPEEIDAVRLALKHKWAMTRDPELLRKSFDEMVENVRRENGVEKTPEGYVMAAHWALNMIRAAAIR